MATFDVIKPSELGSELSAVLLHADIQPGDKASYQVCKSIFVYHPLGKKMAESPVTAAMSMPRLISVPAGPEEILTKAFQDEWRLMGADDIIKSWATLARVYGVAAIGMLEKDGKMGDPVDFENLHAEKPVFNVFDPLNTAGSFTSTQDPNSPDFQRNVLVTVGGKNYNKTRTCVLMNEQPIYLDYTTSGYGYVGRSVYQRALYPLKSFLTTLITDDMVLRKVGVLIAKMKPPGSIADQKVLGLFRVKRNIVKEAETNNVISIGPDEEVESLNLQNLEGPYGMARKNCLENTAVSADMPAVMLNSETFAQGFADGTEDAKVVARYLDGVRAWLQPGYTYFDKIVMHRAWNPVFYETIKARFPEQYGDKPYQTAFYEWSQSFTAQWPNLLTEPESEKAKTDEVRLGAIISVIQAVSPMLDPANKARLFEWAQSNLNANAILFPEPLELDTVAMANYEPPSEVEPETATGLSEAGL